MNTYSYSEISKGVKFLCVKSQKFKTNYVKVDFYLPIDENLAAQNVLATFLGHTSKKYNTFKSFNRKLDELYGAELDTGISCVGEKIKIHFDLEMIDDKFALNGECISKDAIDFLVDILKNPNCQNECFNEIETEREIRFTLETLDASKNDKRAYALSRLRYLMCQNEPYGIDREKLYNDVKNLDGKRLYSAYIDMLKSSTIVITACGTLDEDLLREKFMEFINSISDRSPKELNTVFIDKASETKYFKETMQVNQAKLVMGLRSGMESSDDNYYAFRVMTDIFGGGPYSRLFLNVREKMSLCYYCSSRLVRDKGIIFIQSGIENENYEPALKEILNQLKIMQNGEFTKDDFDSSLMALSDAFRGFEDSPSAICVYYASQAFDKCLLSGRDFAHKILHVTREQVTECAKKVTIDSVYLLSGEEN